VSREVELEGGTATVFWGVGRYLYQVGDINLSQYDVAKLAADVRRALGRDAFNGILDELDDEHTRGGG
jgi:hypothetical protein